MADALLKPVPGADVAAGFVAAETEPGRAVVRRPGATKGGMNFILTDDGWKCVVPDGYPAHLASRILSNEMLAKLGGN